MFSSWERIPYSEMYAKKSEIFVLGWIRDMVGNYVITLHLLNLCTYVTAVSWIAEMMIMSSRKKKRLFKVNGSTCWIKARKTTTSWCYITSWWQEGYKYKGIVKLYQDLIWFLYWESDYTHNEQCFISTMQYS